MQVATQHGANITGEAKCIQNRQQAKQSSITWITKPRFNGDCIVWKGLMQKLIDWQWKSKLQKRTRIRAVCSRTVVQNEHAGQVVDYGGQVFGVTTIIECAMLPEETAPQNPSIVIQFIRYGLSVNFHTCCEHNQIVPLTHLKRATIKYMKKVHVKTKNKLPHPGSSPREVFCVRKTGQDACQW